MAESESPTLSPAIPGRDIRADLAGLITGRMNAKSIPAGQWPELERQAVRHGIGPLLYWTLGEHRHTALAQESLALLEKAAKIAAFNFQLLAECQKEVDLALTRAGVPVVWLKGMALAHTLYPRPDLRPMDDLDLMVPYAQRQFALEVVQRLGYILPLADAGKPDEGETENHHFHLVNPETGRILEIHHRLFRDETILSASEMDWFWQQTEQAGDALHPFAVLKPEANLLYLCAHAILQHGEADDRLQRIYDLHLSAGHPGMDWALVVNRAVDFGWTYALERGLTLAGRYFQTRIPAEVLSELIRRRPAGEDNTRAWKLQGSGRRWEMTLLNMKGRTLSERLRKLYSLTFPSPGALRAHYPQFSERSLIYCYFHRWLDAAREIAGAQRKRLGWEQQDGAPLESNGRGWTLANEDLRDLMRDALARNEAFRFRALGGSMSPFIQPNDLVTVIPLQDKRPEVGQVVAFIQPGSGMLLVHRIVGRAKKGYLLQGDSMAGRSDGLIPLDKVLGCVSRVERSGRLVGFGQGFWGGVIAILSRCGLLVPMAALFGRLRS